ncbi:MAG: glycoside hydrolase family 3 protein [archaeon]|nr:glycoside hydrolase family 3 protein [archaeon]
MTQNNGDLPPYKNTSLTFEERAKDIVSRMTLKEKAAQTQNGAKGIKRLDIPIYNWWNECLHGVASDYGFYEEGDEVNTATVFPQAIGLGATFNENLIFRMADAISTEGRAKYHEFLRNGIRDIFKGITFWSPNINLFRDPRWGRGQETYGEDPFLMGRLGVQFVKGIQGDDPKYLKAVATPKHYAVHSGLENERHKFNVDVSNKDLRESYLPHFKECIIEAKAESIMGAYNRVNGVPCCASNMLLQQILREEWKFDGFVVSDCGAIKDFYRPDGHHFSKNKQEAAAEGIKNGCDLNCGVTYRRLTRSVQEGLITENEISRSVERLFKARFKLGMFDPDEMVPFAQIPFEKNECEEHKQLTLEVAKETMVLLKNEDNFLPLKMDSNDNKFKSIAIIGPNANDKKVLWGNYYGIPSRTITPFMGIKNKVPADVEVKYEKGCEIRGDSRDNFEKAINLAKNSDLVILCLGISNEIEGEEDITGDDRDKVELPDIQQKLLKEIHATGKPIILVLINGGPVSVPWADNNIPAILEAWYPGQDGGIAIADVLFGEYSPAGRLPITIVKATEDLPPVRDYNMKGRTYRYIEKEPLYPFGFGLSYTKFQYSNLILNSTRINTDESLEITVDVENIGDFDSDEVVQLYLKDLEASVIMPHHSLRGFKRINLKKGEKKSVSFTLTPRQIALINNEGKCILEPGVFRISVGGCQPNEQSIKLMGDVVLKEEFEVIGESIELKY